MANSVKATVLPAKYVGYDRVTTPGKKEHMCVMAGQVFDCPAELFKRAKKKGLVRKATVAEEAAGRILPPVEDDDEEPTVIDSEDDEQSDNEE